LGEGPIELVARSIDAAGNASADGPGLGLHIDSTPPPSPTIGLHPSDDSGVTGDGITAVTRPRLTGQAEPGSRIELRDRSGRLLGATTADTEGTFVISIGNPLASGQHQLSVEVADAAGNKRMNKSDFNLRILKVEADYDGDGRADPALFRPEPSAGISKFLIGLSTGGELIRELGRLGDLPLSGDFDGDGLVDFAVFRPESDDHPGISQWFILGSSRGFYSLLFGGAGLDLPAPADYDGDGVTDIATFRPNSDLTPGAAEWFIRPSSAPMAGYRVLFGASGGMDVPVPADYDGDGHADIGVYRSSTGEWFLLGSLAGPSVRVLGSSSQTPAPADYDGDGQIDLAVFRSTDGRWSILRSSDGRASSATPGAVGDLPVLAPLAIRLAFPGAAVPSESMASRAGISIASQRISAIAAEDRGSNFRAEVDFVHRDRAQGTNPGVARVAQIPYFVNSLPRSPRYLNRASFIVPPSWILARMGQHSPSGACPESEHFDLIGRAVPISPVRSPGRCHRAALVAISHALDPARPYNGSTES
jgi:hypothetical protein